MSSTINSIFENADYFLLLFFRVGALFISSPIFGRTNIPNLTKIGFMATLAYFFFIAGPAPVAVEYATLFGFFLLIAREIILGMAMGFVTNLFFTLTYTAGQLIDMQIGFGVVNVYDPQNNTQVPMIGNVLNILLLVLFFIMDGHHRLIYVVYLTLEALPVGTLQLSPNIGLVALEVFANAFTLGVMVALPVIASGLTLEITFGALVRTVPQIHMFVVGMPIKALLGFLLIIILIPVFAGFSERIFSQMFSAMDMMFATLQGG